MFASSWLGRDYWPRAAETTRSRRVRRGSPASLYRAVSDLHRKRRLDLVVVAHSWASLRAPKLGLPWLLDEHNVESRYFAEQHRARQRSGPGIDREVSEIARWERQAWAAATAVACVSDVDAAAIAEHRRTEAGSLAAPVVVANGADLSEMAGAPPELRRGGALFVGAMHHAPNVEAAKRLLEHVMPHVWRELPDLALTIVGGPVSAKLVEAKKTAVASAERIVDLTGIVPDVRPFLAEARVYVNPVTHGAGSSLKIIEALAAGVPVVSTELGARGFDLTPGVHYLSAQGYEEQARAIVRILRDPDLAASLSKAGRTHAERYGWDALGAKFVKLARRAARSRVDAGHQKWSR
jgi:glycosyltransferase involved in cell wall biosynthesis